ncbi:hypothetical protein IGM_01252 [Bacillus cereus HuB4-4]|uniref:Uncharacterized protein n=1 Tax=Bacillus cereus HuB4-4 TaxID=1053211 RepID=A0A9W5QY32_BACCE|nr:hypothetical protein [Bacillus cereus]EOP94820.1 hypothetical protein IGM_01252 [Bacillus cereus HuB4-4]
MCEVRIETRYFNLAVCLVCGHQDKVYRPAQEEYQEVTVCPKCSGAFVDAYKLGKYKQLDHTKSNEEPLVTITLTDIDAVPVVLYKGEEIKGKARVSFDWKTDGHYHKSGPYIHIEHVEDSMKCINTRLIQHNHLIVDKE